MASLNFATVNTGGISRKFASLRHFLHIDQIHIAAITETQSKRPVNITGFHSYNKPSPTTRAKHGVTLLVSTSLASSQHILPPHLDHLQAVAATIHINNLNILFICYYNPPLETVSTQLLDYTSTFRHAVILGDFNARHTDFGDTISNTNGRHLTRSLNTLPLCRLRNQFPTLINHVGTSIVDHIIVTDNLTHITNTDSFIGTTVTSDHLPLVSNFTLQGPQPRPTHIPIFDFNNTNWTDFQNYITNNLPHIDDTLDPNTIDTQVTQLTQLIKQAQTLFVPIKHIPTNRKPLPPQILALIRVKRRIYREFVQTRSPVLKTVFNRLNAQIRRDINQFRLAHWSNSCSSLDYRDGKKFWDKFNSLTGRKSHPIHHLSVNNTIFNTPQDKANCFAATLQNIHQVPNDPHFNQHFFNTVTNNTLRFRQNLPRLDYDADLDPDPDPDFPPDNPDLTAPTTDDEIKALIIRLKNSKAPGPDQIKPILLKHLPDTAITSITTIYNSCFNSGHFPTPWKEATTIMIPKPNKDPNNPLSYRPISLLNILGKIFETILASRLRHTLEENNLLPPEQFGFRPHRSTSDPTFELFTDSTRSANLGQCTLAVFLDVERAFDRVWHDGLIQKFLSHNINLNFIKLIDSFLSNRSCKVKVQNSFSYPVPLLSGVPQGSVLSPILYIFYSSDFPVSDLHQTKTRFFADDTALWTSRTTAASASRTLQPLLNQISTWTRKWRVKINPTKSTAILFKHPNLTRNKKFDPRDITITLNNTPIDLVPSTRTRSRKSATDPTSSAISWETSKGAIPALFSTPTTHSSDPSSSTEPPSTHLSHTPRHIALPHANDKSFAEFTASTASTPAIPSTRTQTPPPSQTVFTNSNKTTSNAHSTTTTQLPKTHSTLHISFSHATTLFATESPGSPEENCPIHPRRFSQRCTPTCPTIFNFSLKRRPSQ
ncbi:probable RNA-directed DNA polymerase from transposon BS [Tribolium castaneum]|uniref:probable RNA-directed DNA polymerase from transposon BS n=1 Tax=Tribolium castaneum TaxID=7070 RepID=UPI0030FE064F